MVWRIKISISESDFDFQIFISPRIASYYIGLHNINRIQSLLCIIRYIICIYIIPYTAHPSILCRIIYVYIIYCYTFFSSEFLPQHRIFPSELQLHNPTIYICQNCICIFLYCIKWSHDLMLAEYAPYHILSHLYFMHLFNITL